MPHIQYPPIVDRIYAPVISSAPWWPYALAAFVAAIIILALLWLLPTLASRSRRGAALAAALAVSLMFVAEAAAAPSMELECWHQVDDDSFIIDFTLGDCGGVGSNPGYTDVTHYVSGVGWVGGHHPNNETSTLSVIGIPAPDPAWYFREICINYSLSGQYPNNAQSWNVGHSADSYAWFYTNKVLAGPELTRQCNDIDPSYYTVNVDRTWSVNAYTICENYVCGANTLVIHSVEIHNAWGAIDDEIDPLGPDLIRPVRSAAELGSIPLATGSPIDLVYLDENIVQSPVAGVVHVIQQPTGSTVEITSFDGTVFAGLRGLETVYVSEGDVVNAGCIIGLAGAAVESRAGYIPGAEYEVAIEVTIDSVHDDWSLYADELSDFICGRGVECMFTSAWMESDYGWDRTGSAAYVSGDAPFFVVADYGSISQSLVLVPDTEYVLSVLAMEIDSRKAKLDLIIEGQQTLVESAAFGAYEHGLIEYTFTADQSATVIRIAAHQDSSLAVFLACLIPTEGSGYTDILPNECSLRNYDFDQESGGALIGWTLSGFAMEEESDWDWPYGGTGYHLVGEGVDAAYISHLDWAVDADTTAEEYTVTINSDIALPLGTSILSTLYETVGQDNPALPEWEFVVQYRPDGEQNYTALTTIPVDWVAWNSHAYTGTFTVPAETKYSGEFRIMIDSWVAGTEASITDIHIYSVCVSPTDGSWPNSEVLAGGIGSLFASECKSEPQLPQDIWEASGWLRYIGSQISWWIGCYVYPAVVTITNGIIALGSFLGLALRWFVSLFTEAGRWLSDWGVGLVSRAVSAITKWAPIKWIVTYLNLLDIARQAIGVLLRGLADIITLLMQLFTGLAGALDVLITSIITAINANSAVNSDVPACATLPDTAPLAPFCWGLNGVMYVVSQEPTLLASMAIVIGMLGLYVTNWSIRKIGEMMSSA